MRTQNDRIRAHLEAGHSITPLEALRLFGCLRLSARIYDLKGDGLTIVAVPTPIDGNRTVATYRLVNSTPERRDHV